MNHSMAVRELARRVQGMIEALHVRAPDDRTFSQLGILDGESTVLDYLQHGELGCAVHHLLYVVHESNIDVPANDVRTLHRIAEAIGEPNYYSEESLSGRTLPPGARVFNRLGPNRRY